MSANDRTKNATCPTVEWTDSTGGRWSATLVPHPRKATEEREIQVESDLALPERVFCFGPIAERFQQLSLEELELIRRASQARRGLLWLDPRDGQLWWVNQGAGYRTGAQLTYSNFRRTLAAAGQPRLAVSLLETRDHQRLLDDARSGRSLA